MRQLKCLLFVLLLFAKVSTAQSNQIAKYAISVQPLQLLSRDVPINFERIYRKSTIGFTIGYRFSSILERNPIGVVRYFVGTDGTLTSPRFNGITLGANSKLFLGKKRVYYLDGQIFYRHCWFNDRAYRTYHSRGDDYNYITSGHTNVFGAKLLFGIRKSCSNKGTIRPICYSYIGVGFRFKEGNEVGQMGITNYSIPTPNYQPYEDNFQTRTPTFHLGFNFGIEIFQKKLIE